MQVFLLLVESSSAQPCQVLEPLLGLGGEVVVSLRHVLATLLLQHRSHGLHADCRWILV